MAKTQTLHFTNQEIVNLAHNAYHDHRDNPESYQKVVEGCARLLQKRGDATATQEVLSMAPEGIETTLGQVAIARTTPAS